MSLNETYTEELEIDALLNFGTAFIRTPELAWYDALYEAKTKYQRLIFPKGVIFNIDGFSNPSLGLPFKIINDIAASASTNVDYRFILSNSIVDGCVQTLREWRIIFQQFPLAYSNATI